MNHIVKNKIENGYEFHLWNNIVEAFSIYKKHFFSFLLLGLIFNVLHLGLSSVPMGGILVILILPCLQVGFSVIANKIKKNEKFVLKDYFAPFSKFAPFMGVGLIIFLMSLIITVIIIFVIVVLFFTQLKGGFPTSGQMLSSLNIFWSNNQILLIILGSIFIILITLIYMSVIFSPNLIYFYNLDAFESVKSSRKLVNKKFFYLIIMQLILFIIQFGTIALIYKYIFSFSFESYFDIFRNINNPEFLQEYATKARYQSFFTGLITAFFVPYNYLLIYCAFDDIMGLTKETELPDITAEHFIAE